MSFVTSLRQRLPSWLNLFGDGDDEPKNIGIYGPPNTGKTTLANRIIQDWSDPAEIEDEGENGENSEFGSESHIPHETRRAERKSVTIEHNNNSVQLDVVDTPGVTSEVDYQEFMQFDMDKEDAVERSREATEGIAEAMHWLREDIDGVIYVLDSTKDPFTQVNTMLIGLIESQDLPVLVFANKIDLEDSNVKRIENAFPQHKVVELSALKGKNVENAYKEIAEHFG